MAEVLLFSYGTLQNPKVQQANFGRLLDGMADSLVGFVQAEIEITDPEVIAERIEVRLTSGLVAWVYIAA